MTPPEDQGLWVRSDVMSDGSYGVAVTVGADCAFSLNRVRAIGYATACMAHAMEADHDVAVLRLLTERLKLRIGDAGTVVLKSLREHRPCYDVATAPVRFSVLVGSPRSRPRVPANFLPIVQMHIGGEEIGCVSPRALRAHAEGVLTTLAAAELDANLFRYLTTEVELGAGPARAVVANLAEYLPADTDE